MIPSSLSFRLPNIFLEYLRKKPVLSAMHILKPQTNKMADRKRQQHCGISSVKYEYSRRMGARPADLNGVPAAREIKTLPMRRMCNIIGTHSHRTWETMLPVREAGR